MRAKLIATIVVIGVIVFALTSPGADSSFVASGPPLPLPEASVLTEMSADLSRVCSSGCVAHRSS